MKTLIALVGLMSSPGGMMGPPQGAGSGLPPPVSPYTITTESDVALTTESDEILYTEAAP